MGKVLSFWGANAAMWLQSGGNPYVFGAMMAERYLFKTKGPQGPRLRAEDLAVQLAQEGADLPRGWGTWRQAGTIVYSSRLLEHQSTEDAGGKGPPKSTVFTYSTSLAIMGGQGPISRVNRIWADGTVVYDDGKTFSTWLPNQNYVAGDFVRPTVPNGFEYRATNSGKTNSVEPAWPAGLGVTVSDTNGVDPGVFWSTEASGTQTGFTLIHDGTTGVYSGTNPNSSGASLDIYTGTMNQPVNSYLEGVKGVGKTSGQLGNWYVVLQNFQLANFGNRVPNFTAEVTYDTNDLPSIITEIASWVGLAAADLDLTDLSGITVRGYVVPSRRAAAAAIQELMNAYSFRMVEVDGLLRAVRLSGKSPVVTLTDRDVRWKSAVGGEAAPVTLFSSRDQQDLPEVQEVQFFDTAREYNVGYRYARRQVIDTRKKASTAFNLALQPQEAQDIAERMLGEQWEEQRAFTPQLSMRQLALACGDEVTVPTPQGSHNVILRHLKVPLFGALDATAPSYNANIYAVPAETAPTSTIPKKVIVPIYFTTLGYGVGNWPSLRDLDNAGLTVYAYASMGYNGGYQGVRVRGPGISMPGGETFVDLPYEACVGSGVIAQSGNTGEGLVWDRASTITIDLISRDLSSVADEAYVMEHDAVNACMFGQELIQFRTATYDAGLSTPTTHRYVLSDLLRGRRGTEVFMDSHSGTEPFVLLDGGVKPIVLSSVQIGRALPWQFLIRWVEHDVTVTPDGTNLKPYAPLHLRGTLNLPASGDVTFTWDRQSRYYNSYLQTGAEGIMGEESLKFEVDVLDAANTTILRTIATSTASAVYTNAQQVADFGSLQSHYHINVRQIGAIIEGYNRNVDIVPE